MRLEAVETRLQRLEEVISEIEFLSQVDPKEFQNRLSEMWKVERGLQLGAEILLDIGNHILVTQFGVSPAGYREIIERLSARGVISCSLMERLRGLAGFRNILVHDYLDLDQDLVLKVLDRAPQDLSEYVREIRDWLGNHEATQP